MKLKNKDIWIAQEPLKTLMEQKLPIRVSYDIIRLVSKLSEQFKVIEETRQGLIKKYGKSDEKGQMSVEQGSESWEKFVSEFNELMSLEVEVVFDKIKLPEKISSTCNKCNHSIDKPFEIEAKILMALDKFVEV